MSEETKEEVTEVTKAKSFIDTLIDENRSTNKEDILKLTATKKDIETAIKDLKAFRTKYKPIFFKSNYIVDEDEEDVWEVKDSEVFSESLDELRINTRQYAIAKEKRLLFIIRQEELISLINSLQGKLEKYDKLVAEKGEDAAAHEFTNLQLQEINMMRTQTIPMYLIELETLASAIKDNEETFVNSGAKIYEISSGIIKYLEEQVS
jgi:hypothetical protein